MNQRNEWVIITFLHFLNNFFFVCIDRSVNHLIEHNLYLKSHSLYPSQI